MDRFFGTTYAMKNDPWSLVNYEYKAKSVSYVAFSIVLVG
jgi:hypothetical protein